jgi:glycosyltransferase involved in cell wall biosynthesis
MSRVHFFTKYTAQGASSRYRTYQYIDGFENEGLHTALYPLFSNNYVQQYYQTGRKNIWTIVKAYYRRIQQIRNVPQQEILFIEYELFPYLPLWLESFLLRKRKYVLDYDDALFHQYNQSRFFPVRWLLGYKLDQLATKAATVITGSPYLTAYFQQYNSTVVEIPTSLNPADYYTASKPLQPYLIGWLGSHSSVKNLFPLIPALQQIQSKYGVGFVFCGVPAHLQTHFSVLQVDFISWSGAAEKQMLAQIHAGIMPLADTSFNRGKCGFKLIQYMAAGLPTVSTPLEANIKINRSGKNLHAHSVNEWVVALEKLIENAAYYATVGQDNLQIVNRYYSIQQNTPLYIQVFKSIC